jgi:hypothetical protein
MKRLSAAIGALVLFIAFAGISHAGETYYARCNLKVAKGNSVSWINWQASPTFIPAGTKLTVEGSGSSFTLTRQDTGQGYTLDTGADGEAYLHKFVTKKRVDISKYPANIQSSIRASTAKVGMTKEQVYISMGPPSNFAHDRTNQMTYEQIMEGDLWTYARRRFGKNIGVEFNHKSGKVIRTEAIWN